jgi:hypothetical protein
VQRKGSATILTGDYLDVSDPDALQQLLDLSADPDVEGHWTLVFSERPARAGAFIPRRICS